MTRDLSFTPDAEGAPLPARPQDGTTERQTQRAADADREAAAAALRQHYTAGRLDAVEYDERLTRCYGAKTLGTLDALFPDLPRLSPVTAAPISPDPYPPRPHRYPTTRKWTFVSPFAPPLAIVLVVTLIVGIGFAGAHHIWFAWPLLFFAFRSVSRGNWHRSRGDYR